MKKEELQHRAYQTYAALGELSVKRKQLAQQLNQIDQKVLDLEKEIVRLSKIEVESNTSNLEGVSNVD